MGYNPRPTRGLVSSGLALFVFSAYVNYNVIQIKQTARIIMAANQLVQARIDGEIKEEAAAVLAAMGLTVSDAVRLMLTRVAREKALPFEPLIPNVTTIAAMKEARSGNLPRFDSIQSLMDDLNAED
jgi:DNA-damage-inducible protein J